MKLISVDLSPYAARVRLAIYFKGLDIKIEAPGQGGLKSPEHLALNPIGKIPVLVLDDGTGLPESETILEYIEDIRPQPPLRPSDPLKAAKARLLARIGDIYVMEPLRQLFRHLDPAQRQDQIVAKEFESLEGGLQFVENYLISGRFALGDAVSIADCSIVPVLFFVNVIGRSFDKPDLIAPHAKLSAYWTSVAKEPPVAKVLAELDTAVKARLTTR